MLYVSVGLLLYNALSPRGASPAHPSGSGRPSLIMTLEGLRTLQNIEEILKANNIEGDAATAIAKAVGENYKTVAEVEQKAKKLTETQAALDNANKALDEAKKAAESADVDGLKAKIAEYEEAAKKRTEADEEAKKRAAFDEEFGKALGKKAFANSVVKEAVTEKAYTLRKANADMPIADILKIAAPDEAGIWANPQTDPHKMPGADGAAAGVSPITSLDQLKTMSPDDINKNWADVQKLLAQQ